MLVLLDIDGTLLASEGTGARGIVQAGSELFGESFSLDGIPLGGRLDPLIFGEAMEAIGRTDHREHHDAFRKRYLEVFAELIEIGHDMRILPGVSELLGRMHAHPEITMALVTGNYRESAHMKLAAAGIDPELFVGGAFGDEGDIRDDLPPLAIERFRAARGRAPRDVVLLGDTVHDVTSGRAAGCRVLAVCTGSHAPERLHASKPELVLDDLSDVEAVMAWILSKTGGDA
ncbi:MAG: haloacid dehalogenase [Phycisphaerae bacterium]|nr:haloacid dehalogenase [Phycisphaerae bacterium]HBZ96899.1 haloacid dehalogenase [Phycisphaerales bacterium]